MRYRLLLALALSTVGACSSFDATRIPAPRGTLGEEIVRVFCERMYSGAERARPEGEPRDVSGVAFRGVCRGDEAPGPDAPARVVALMANRERLVAALDAVLPEDITDELGSFLGQLLPLMDDPRERVPTSTRLMSDFLAALSADDAALDSMSRLGRRTGYRPLRLGLGVLRPALSYPELDSFVRLALRTLTDLPDDLGDGLAVAEWQAVQAALALELATLAPADPLPPGEPSTVDLTRELMFTVDTRFGGSTAQRWVLLRDERGMALPAGGVIAAPFVDADGDGLADVDARGRFVDASLAPLALPAPFAVLGEAGAERDAAGRALSGGAPVYSYLDADDTLLAGLVREALPWFDAADPTLLRLSRGLPFLLGAPGPRSETYGTYMHSYEGWDPARSSLVDLVYGASELMHRDGFDDVLSMLDTLIRDHESEAAGLVDSAHHMLTRSDAYPAARLRAGNSFWDDLIELAIRLDRRPGMLEAVIRSFADRRSEVLGGVYAGLMRNRDRITYNPADPNGSPLGFPLDDRVDHTIPDVDGNESLFERSIAVIDGLDGVRVCNRAGARLDIDLGLISLRYPLIGTAGECELIDIPNVAEAYALAILGTYELEIQDPLLRELLRVGSFLGIDVDAVLERSSAITGLTTHPSPQALNRLVFWALDGDGTGRCDPAATGTLHCNSEFASQVFARIRDRHGNDVIDTYHGTLFAWEQPGFYDGMRPLVEVLHDPRYRVDADGNYAFGNIIATIFVHWPSAEHWVRQSTDPAAPNYVPGDDGRSYEDLVADGFDPMGGDLVGNLVDASVLLDGLDMGGGRDGLDVLSDAAHDLLNPDASPGLTTRDGRASIPRNDGGGVMAVTPMLLLLDALRNIDRDLAAIPDDLETAEDERLTRVLDWHAARDSLAAQFLDTRPIGAGYAFRNQRTRAIVLAILPFLRDRVDAHRTAGDVVTWSRELPTDLSDLLGSPLVGGFVRFLDRVNRDPEARDALLNLLSYLLAEGSENDAFLSILYAVADLLQVMSDDLNLVPLARALSPMLAANARDVVATGAGPLDLTGSMTFDALGLLREIQAVDTASTLPAILRNLVALQADESTPLETILDVISEVNRAAPGVGGAYDQGDYRTMFGEMTGAMDDTRHGMERLYDVVQERELR